MRTIVTKRFVPGSHHNIHICPVCGNELRWMYRKHCEYCETKLEWGEK